MKLFSRLMTRKPDPEEIAAMDLEKMEERSRKATADDSGGENPSLKGDLYPGIEAADPAPEDAYAEQSWDDEDWEDEDWGDDWDDDDISDEDGEVRAALVDGIRDAMEDVAHSGEEHRDIQNWSEDDELERKAAARKELGAGDEATEDRILQKTNSEMTSIMSSRRRSAMAHLKKAAAATKADRVLSHVVGRDPSADPDEQSPYRDDLAKVVKPRATSRPVSRPVSRSPKVQAAWEDAPADEDAGLMAEASDTAVARVQSRDIDRAAFEAERQQHLPADLTEDEFISDGPLTSISPSDPSEDDEDEEFGRPTGAAAWSRPIFENEEELSEEEQAVALATRRASRVRSSLVDADDTSDEFDALDTAEEPDLPAADWGLGGDNGPSGPDNEFADGLDDDDFDDDDEDWSAPSLDAPEPEKTAVEVTDDPAPVMAEAPEAKPVDLSAIRDGMDQLRSRNLSDEEMAQDEQEDAPMDLSQTRISGRSADSADVAPDPIVEVPTPAMGRAGRSAGGRVKTRLLGFQASEAEPDVFDKADKASASGRSQFPVGWIVVVDGPGTGQAFTLQGGVMQIGRGENQGVQLDFGDTAISRENHAAVAYDDETGKFFLGHGGKSNLVRLNGSPVLSTEELSDRDRIRIGETTLMFVKLCNEDFIWNADKGED